MGAYDNMFSNASTFKVELDEWFDLLCLPLNIGKNISSTVAKFFVTRHPSHWLSSMVREIFLVNKKSFLIYFQSLAEEHQPTCVVNHSEFSL